MRGRFKSVGITPGAIPFTRMPIAPHSFDRPRIKPSTPDFDDAYARTSLRLMKLLKLDVDALSDLTCESCAKFNNRIEDSPGVKYFSISASRPWHRVPPIFLHSHKLISGIEGANDGIVSVASAKWGEHLETWPADHLHVINKRFVRLRDRTGDMVPYYFRMLDQVTG